MFVRSNRNWTNRLRAFRYKTTESNIAFKCIKKYPGFTRKAIYKPFTYTATSECYTDFGVFDNKGRVLYIEKSFIKKGIFKVIHNANLLQNEYVQMQEQLINECVVEEVYRMKYGSKMNV